MKKEFIPYEQALALKELKFDEPCLGWWSTTTPNIELMIEEVFPGEFKTSTLLAPLYQQAFRWFRKKYNRLHTVNIDLSNNLKDKVFVYTIEDHLGSIVDRSEEFNTYEEAELACLIKLIEIVKEK
jgi:hypothetical protein